MLMKNLCTVFLFVLGLTMYCKAQLPNNLTHTYVSNFSHDSLHCESQIIFNHIITKHNSFLGDTVKVLNSAGSILYQEINLSGASIWNINYPFVETLFVPDHFVNNGLLFYGSNSEINKIVSGTDSILNIILAGSHPVSNPCLYNSVSGNIYIDYDNNCSFTSGDLGVTNLYPSIQANYSQGNAYSYNNTNTAGNYVLHMQESWLTSYTVSIPSIYNFAYQPSSCFSSSYSFTSLPQINVDFPLQCLADIDVRVHAYHSWARPAIPFNLITKVSNIGCSPVSGSLKLVLDSNVTYNAANSLNPADMVSGDTLIWNYVNLNNLSNAGVYFNQFFGNVSLTPSLSVNIGDTLWFSLITHTPANDANPANNSYHFGVPILNSYDPNLKEVSPKGVGQEGFISPLTQKLTYTIHFQNTGNAPAINVRILDTLEQNLISNSLRILESSHPMSPNWLANNVIEFNFNNINLPDSLSDEPASHGFVRFEVDMVQGLTPGTEIKNKVDIYFDTNAPIVTNYALNTIEYPHGFEVNNSNGMELKVFPNPSSDFVYFSLEQKISGTIKIMDITGKIVLTERLNNAKFIKLNLENYPAGFYVYEIDDFGIINKRFTGKLIKK